MVSDGREEPADRGHVLAPLRHRDFRRFAAATWTSQLGDGFFLVAIALQVYAVSNVPTAMAAVGIAWSASQLALLLPGGLASDRFERRKIMVAADLVRAAAIGTMGFASIAGRLQLSHILVLGAVFGIGNAFFNPAAGAILPTLVPDDRLPQANALRTMARPVMQELVGPGLGGVLIAASGPGVALIADAATFLVSAAFVWSIRPRAAVIDAESTLADSARQIGEGLRYVRRTPWLWAWFAAAGLSLLAFAGPFETLLPYVLTNELRMGGRELGLVFAAGGVGSLVVLGFVGRFRLPARFMAVLYLAEAGGVALLFVFGIMTHLWQAVLASFVMHGLFAFTALVWDTTLQRLVPDRLLGRVFSLDWFASIGLVPLSYALTGPLALAWGARGVLIGGGLVGAGLLVALLFIPGARDPEHLLRGRGALGIRAVDPAPTEFGAGRHDPHPGPAGPVDVLDGDVPVPRRAS